jgi:hypothetical protein
MIALATPKLQSSAFRKSGNIKQNLCWKYDNEVIDIVDDFNYLGVTLNLNGNFNLIKHRVF